MATIATTEEQQRPGIRSVDVQVTNSTEHDQVIATVGNRIQLTIDVSDTALYERGSGDWCGLPLLTLELVGR